MCKKNDEQKTMERRKKVTAAHLFASKNWKYDSYHTASRSRYKNYGMVSKFRAVTLKLEIVAFSKWQSISVSTFFFFALWSSSLPFKSGTVFSAVVVVASAAVSYKSPLSFIGDACEYCTVCYLRMIFAWTFTFSRWCVLVVSIKGVTQH